MSSKNFFRAKFQGSRLSKVFYKLSEKKLLGVSSSSRTLKFGTKEGLRANAKEIKIFVDLLKDKSI